MLRWRGIGRIGIQRNSDWTGRCTESTVNLNHNNQSNIMQTSGLVKLRSMFEKLTMKSGLYQENRLEIEETETARLLRTDELYAQRKKEHSTMHQLLSQIQTLQDKVNALNEEKRIFTIWRQRAALEGPTFPVNPREFRVQEVCVAAILDCRTVHGIRWVLQEMFF